jgi:muramoyltetrapeptide carboxypeptidase LdcA involved in peptidoglycan recycling
MSRESETFVGRFINKAPEITSKPLMKQGDYVAILEMARASSPQHLELAKKFIISLGLKPLTADEVDRDGNILSDEPRKQALEKAIDKKGYLGWADTPEVRANNFAKLFRCGKVAAFWPMRGEGGTGEALDQNVLKALHKHRPKNPHAGLLTFSCGTANHLWMEGFMRFQINANNLLEFVIKGFVADATLTRLKEVLFDNQPTISFTDLKPANIRAEIATAICGQVVGGNFGVMAAHISDYWFKDQILNNKILIIEQVFNDTGHFHQSDRDFIGFLKKIENGKLKAIIFGDILVKVPNRATGSDKTFNLFVDNVNNEALQLTKSDKQYIEDFRAHLIGFCQLYHNKVPLFTGLRVGHSRDLNLPVPFYTNSAIKISKDKTATLTCDLECSKYKQQQQTTYVGKVIGESTGAISRL